MSKAHLNNRQVERTWRDGSNETKEEGNKEGYYCFHLFRGVLEFMVIHFSFLK
jgi:hypothetical protein